MLPSREVWGTRPEEDPDCAVPSCGASNLPRKRVVYPMPPDYPCEDERATITETPFGYLLEGIDWLCFRGLATRAAARCDQATGPAIDCRWQAHRTTVADSSDSETRRWKDWREKRGPWRRICRRLRRLARPRDGHGARPDPLDRWWLQA